MQYHTENGGVFMKRQYVVFEEKNKPVLKCAEMREIADDEVLIELDYSVISAGTERAMLTGMPNVTGKFPRIPGYSGCGHVIKVGKSVTDVKPGDKVLCDHLGHTSLAAARRSTGSGKGYIKIPDDTDMLEACFVVIGSMGLQGLRKTKPQLGETIMITGLGILGMFALQGAVLCGGAPVIAVDFDKKRLETALEYGADYAFSPQEPDFAEKVKAVTDGRMINCNIEVTGSAKALEQALHLAAPMGRIALTGCTRISDVNIDYYSLVHRPGIQLIGAHNFVRPAADSYEGYWTRHDDYSTILRFMKRGKMSAKPIISEIIGLSDIERVYMRLVENPNAPLGIVIDWHKK